MRNLISQFTRGWFCEFFQSLYSDLVTGQFVVKSEQTRLAKHLFLLFTKPPSRNRNLNSEMIWILHIFFLLVSLEEVAFSSILQYGSAFILWWALLIIRKHQSSWCSRYIKGYFFCLIRAKGYLSDIFTVIKWFLLY